MTEPENQAEALKPCPFCGSGALGHGHSYPPEQGDVQCYDCGGAMIAPTEDEAIAAWNRRASLPEAPAVPVGVKALEWRTFCSNSGNCDAKTPFGEYVIQSEEGQWVSYLLNGDSALHDTLASAKAAAQADFEARIRSAIQSNLKAVDREECERICDATAMRQWEASLKRPDLTEKDRVRGALEAFKRQAVALDMLAALASQPAAEGDAVAWRDMESAPKDEEVLIAYWRWRNSMSPGSIVVQSAQLTEHHGKGIWSWVVSDNKHGPFPLRGYCEGDILGWMPLPSALSLAARREQPE